MGAGKPLAWQPDFYPTGHSTGVKGDEKHHEATKSQAGVDHLSGLGIPDRGCFGADGVLPGAAVGLWWPVVG